VQGAKSLVPVHIVHNGCVLSRLQAGYRKESCDKLSQHLPLGRSVVGAALTRSWSTAGTPAIISKTLQPRLSQNCV
jgi:hypothetical protein